MATTDFQVVKVGQKAVRRLILAGCEVSRFHDARRPIREGDSGGS
jgi:hypothetical protein